MSSFEERKSRPPGYPEARRPWASTSAGCAWTDEARPESDVDILVEFRETPGLTKYMGLKFWLEDSLGRPVDLKRAA